MITKAEWDMILGYVAQYHKAMLNGGKPLRLFVTLLDFLKSFDIPDQAALRLENEVTAVYSAAIENRPIPTPRIRVTFTVSDGSVVLAS